MKFIIKQEILLESLNHTNLKATKEVNEFLTKLKLEDSYKTDNSSTLSDKEVKFYTNNFYPNEYLSLYQYKKVTVYTQGIFEDYSFSNQDVYKNELGVFIDNFL